jgi:hypothetical protein
LKFFILNFQKFFPSLVLNKNLSNSPLVDLCLTHILDHVSSRYLGFLKRDATQQQPKAPYKRLLDAEDETKANYNEFRYSRRLVMGLCGTIAVIFSAFITLLWQYFHMEGPSQLQCAKLNSPYCEQLASMRADTRLI